MRIKSVIEPMVIGILRRLVNLCRLTAVTELRVLVSHKCLGKKEVLLIYSKILKNIFIFFFARPYRHVGRILMTTIFLKCNRHEFQG